MTTTPFPYRYLALFYALLIFAASAIPTAAPTLGFRLGDKVLHFLEYAVFSFLLFLALFTSGKEFLRRHVFVLSCFVGIAYALTDELHQKLVPGRSCDVFDFLADSLGIIVVQIAVWLYLKRKQRRLTTV